MVGSNSDNASDGHFTDNGSEPEEDQTCSSERVFLSERAGRRVYRQMETNERLQTQSLEKLDTLIELMRNQTALMNNQMALMQNLVQLQTGQQPTAPVPLAPVQTAPAPAQPAPVQPTPRPPLPIQDARFQTPPVTTAQNQRRMSPNNNVNIERPPPTLTVPITPNTVSPITTSPLTGFPPANPANTANTANMAPYKLTGKVPTFSGKNVENVRIWLQQMDDLFTAARVPEEDQKNTRTALTTPHLLGSANGFYWSLYYANGYCHLSWPRFKQEMTNQYNR